MQQQISSKSRMPFPRLLMQRTNFSAQEVLERLRSDITADPRTTAVHAAAARTAVWSSKLPDRIAFDLGRAATRLPSVVFWYCQGVSTEEIGRRLSPFGSAWDAERALDVAATLIAKTLNQGDPDKLAA